MKKTKLFKRTITKDLGPYNYGKDIVLSGNDKTKLKKNNDKRGWKLTKRQAKYYYYEHLRARMEADKLKKKLSFTVKKNLVKDRTYKLSVNELRMKYIEELFEDALWKKTKQYLEQGNYPAALDMINEGE